MMKKKMKAGVIDVNVTLSEKIKRLSDEGRKLHRDNAQSDAEKAYAKFMDAILPGWEKDPNCQETPKRVAKMFIHELLSGIYYPAPKITSFENLHHYGGMVFSGDISVKSMCSHHHMPFFGKAYVAYIPVDNGEIIGLSKLNRLVNYYARRAQVQENLTANIHEAVNKLVGKNKGVAVYIEATHTCVSHRGANDSSVMKTAQLSELFFSNEIGTRDEFYRMVADLH